VCDTPRAGRRGVVLALGNDILGDDGVGIAAGRLLQARLPAGVDSIEAGFGGFHLLDYLEGYPHALVLDALCTRQHSPGTVLELDLADLRLVAGSPHYVGLPEILTLAETLGLPLPPDLRVLGLEVTRLDTFGTDLSPAVAAALPGFVDRAAAIVATWE
jgi:hydrogenase maturation protease